PRRRSRVNPPAGSRRPPLTNDRIRNTRRDSGKGAAGRPSHALETPRAAGRLHERRCRSRVERENRSMSKHLFSNIPLLLACLGQATAERPPGTFDNRFEEIKRSASRKELYELLFVLPKGGDLHNHHEYSAPMEAWLEVATDSRLLHGNAYFTRTVTERCPGERD